MALGYFNITIGRRRYGVQAPDASLLAASYDAVLNRLRHRGSHTASFAAQKEPQSIVESYCHLFYGASGSGHGKLAVASEEFMQVMVDRQLVWAPDGDAAFDDGSHVFQFDIGETVRLIGFVNDDPPHSINDVTVDAGLYYDVLAEWSEAFYKQWSTR